MSLRRLVLTRLGWGLGMIVLVTGLVFVIFNLLPSGDAAMSRPGATAEQVEVVQRAFGSDQPVYAQYVDFLGNLAQLDLGESFRYGVPVSDLIADRLLPTLMLMCFATIIWLVFGALPGVIAAARPGSAFDRLAGAGSLLLISTPVFVLGYLALLLFAAGTGSLIPFLPGVGAFAEADGIAAQVAALILPSIVLGLGLVGLYFRLSRASIGEQMRSDFVLAARARGVGERDVLWRHAFRSGISPILTSISLDFVLVAAGNVVLVEAVFNIPGVGGLLVSSLERSDLPVIQGVVLFTALLVVVINIVVDVTQALLDPRVTPTGPPRRRRSRAVAGPAHDPSSSS